MKQQQKSTQIKLLLVLLFLPHFGFTQSNIPQYNFTFEDTTHEYFMYRDTLSNPNCIWQVGEPNKTAFNAPFSVSNCIITDTINSYPINDTSSFIIKHEVGDGYFELAGVYPIVYLAGNYYVNSDTLNDYGKIEFSPDNGLSWVLISEDTLTLQGNGNSWPNFEYNPIFTGNSNGWKPFQISLAGYDYATFNSGDTVQYKFTFISDGIIDNLDGLMFDDLKIVDDIGGGTEEFSKSSKNSYPNPFSNQLTFKLKTSATRLVINDINGKVIYNSSVDNQTKIEINTAHFKSGMYFYELLDENGDGIERGKVVKQ